MNQALFALSPLDGRYASKTAPLRDFFSEAALIQARVQIELYYLTALAKAKIIPPLTSEQKQNIKKLFKPRLIKWIIFFKGPWANRSSSAFIR